MKYSSLKRQPVNTLKVKAFDGGVDLQNPERSIENNQLSSCKNMWFKDSRLQTRPGFLGDVKKAVKTQIYGYTGKLDYNITDTEVYYNDSYHRIAISNVLTDDYAHYTYVYLVDLEGNINPIGNMSFLRITSDTFYTPINILFYNGKSETGGGIFAFVTLQNGGDTTQRYYYIYEIDATFSEWNRVFDFYVPTIYINGRGNLYDTARHESSFSAPNPKTLESPNILNGRFNAYYTSDGYSNSFRLPFSNLANESVLCRIYYTLQKYVDWRIEAGETKNTQTFFDKSICVEIDRTKGTLYFTTDGEDYPVPVMTKYHENNIKITATKEIPKGFSRVVHSTCSVRNNSKLLISGGESGNTVFVTSYENPLYFPQNSCATVGDVDAEITALSVQQGKIIAFKEYEIYALGFKSGANINEISLLSDNDTIFKKADSIEVSQICERIGCENKHSLVLCGRVNYWLGKDNNIYSLKSVASQEIENVSEKIKSGMPQVNAKNTFAVGNEDFYILINGANAVAVDIKRKGLYLWEIPEVLSLQSGFYHNAKFRFICVSPDSTIAYIATLNGEADSYMFYDEKGNISALQSPIKNSMTTKHFALTNMGEFKNIDSIFLSLSAVGKTAITLNGSHTTNINFSLSDEKYNRCEHKAVRLIPHLYGVDSVYLTVSSDDLMSIGEAEISYRITG